MTKFERFFHRIDISFWTWRLNRRSGLSLSPSEWLRALRNMSRALNAAAPMGLTCEQATRCFEQLAKAVQNGLA
jgi:hypothetical protein